MLKKYLFIVFIILINILLNGSQNTELLEKIASVGFKTGLIFGIGGPLLVGLIPTIVTRIEKNKSRWGDIAIGTVFAIGAPALIFAGLSLSIAAVAKLGALGVKHNLFTPTQYGLVIGTLGLISYFYYRNKQQKLSSPKQN